jgi:hypothetical protein
VATEEALGRADQLARELRGTSLKLNEQALNKILESIRELDRAVERQGQINQIRRRMDDLMVASAQRSALTAGRFGNRASAANPTPAPETGNADMAGGMMFRQGAVARDENNDSGHEGSHTGAALGHSDALAVEGTRTERLEAKLRREALAERAGAKEQDGEGNASWYYKATEGAAARTQFATAETAERQAGAGALESEAVPMAQKRAVKEYFIHLHEGQKK